MALLVAPLLLIAAFAALPVLAEQPVVFGQDGSVTVSFTNTNTSGESITLTFGLPSGPPLKTWREGNAARRLWVTNGIHYTQSLLVVEVPRSQPAGHPDRPALVLLVNIEGQNTNSEYAEAAAELAAEVNRVTEPLELKDGLVWRTYRGHRRLLGGLEIPESGIESPQGERLRFRGNMPPSLNGSMTLKLPLCQFDESDEIVTSLADLSFEEQFRRSARSKPNVQWPPREIILRPDEP